MKTTVSLCKCNGCDQVLINPNPKHGSRLYKVEQGRYNVLETSKEQTHVCPKCGTDHYLIDEVMEEMITVSLGLYYSTIDKAHYVQMITAIEQQHLFFRVSKALAEEISMNNLVEIVETDESLK